MNHHGAVRWLHATIRQVLPLPQCGMVPPVYSSAMALICQFRSVVTVTPISAVTPTPLQKCVTICVLVIEELLESVAALGCEPDILCVWPAFDLSQGLVTPADE